MNKKTLAAAGVAAIALGTYLFAGNTEKQKPEHDIAPNIKQMVHDFSTGNTTAQSASITSGQLIVTGDNSKEITYNLPEDEFFLSIAPYIDKTHPCAIHSLTGCQGEMTDEEFSVAIQDSEGNSVMDKTTMKSQDNGFIDLWLPRDKTYHITVEHDGKTAESAISTFENDDTCIATMQLKDKQSL